MIDKKIENALLLGENIAIEFKLCEGGISIETYKTVCSFLNRYGGDIFLGIDDNCNAAGIPQKAIPNLVKNFISTISNPELLLPTVYLAPEILKYNNKFIIHIHVPPSSEVHSFKKVIYDRVNDADVKVTATNQIAAMYIRKQNIFTERKVYPFIKKTDLSFDMLPRIRQMALNRDSNHAWKKLNDNELLESARLYVEDRETGKKGYNLAAILLLGKDDIIQSILPAYRTDAILRKVNLSRYDDRLIVTTNLINSYDLLMEFSRKHLWDKFYLEGDVRVSLREIITREMLVNTLIHREFTSTYISKFIIEKDKMFVENANRAVKDGVMTLENFEPNPKNPIIASFFRNIGLADELGSGVRNLYHYGLRYSGKEPELIDGDIFRIIVPLDDNYSFGNLQEKGTENNPETVEKGREKGREKILELIKDNVYITQNEMATMIGLSVKGVEKNIRLLKSEGLLERIGPDKGGYWKVNNE